MRLGWVVVIVLAWVALAGCGGSGQNTTTAEPAEQPGEFIERVLGHYVKQEPGRSWDLLHPGHQSFVSREKFVACRSDLFPSTVKLDSIKVEGVDEESMDVPGIPQETSKLVTYVMTLRLGEETQAATLGTRIVLVNGRWRWILPSADIGPYRAGKCPS